MNQVKKLPTIAIKTGDEFTLPIKVEVEDGIFDVDVWKDLLRVGIKKTATGKQIAVLSKENLKLDVLEIEGEPYIILIFPDFTGTSTIHYDVWLEYEGSKVFIYTQKLIIEQSYLDNE